MLPPVPGDIHLDQALERSVEVLGELIDQGALRKAVLINDLFGKIRVALWPTPGQSGLQQSVAQQMEDACKGLWSGTIWLGTVEGAPASDDDVVAEAAWNGGVVTKRAALRINDRHRNRTSWFLPPTSSSAPPLVVAFYSFKGGVGRTTAAAALALSWARRGRRVAVIDFDLDAPGLGRLLDADGQGTTAPWGVVDYLLEIGVSLPLADYRHTCARPKVTGDGVIDVYPAGALDERYLSKLGKLDLELQDATSNPLARLIAAIHGESRPDLIIVDSRAGLSPAAGLVLGGIAHLHVVVSTAGEQALAGLQLVIRRLGEARIRSRIEQAECVLVQTMIPDHSELSANAIAYFATRAEDIFREHYYVPKPDPDEPDADERWWALSDVESSEAPHRAACIRYKAMFADFRSIDDIADDLVEDKDYTGLVERIDRKLLQFTASPVEEDD